MSHKQTWDRWEKNLEQNNPGVTFNCHDLNTTILNSLNDNHTRVSSYNDLIIQSVKDGDPVLQANNSVMDYTKKLIRYYSNETSKVQDFF